MRDRTPPDDHELRSDTDLLRDLAEGRLDRATAAEAQRLANDDADAAAFLADYRSVSCGALEDCAPIAPCNTEFADLVLDEAAASPARPVAPVRAPTPMWRRVAAAAALLVAVGAAYAVVDALTPAAPPTLALTAIPLETPAGAMSPSNETASVPERLASYVPTIDDQIQWLDSLEEARELSRWLGRPLLVYGWMETCPWCQELDEGTYTDDEIVALANDFIPVRVDVKDVIERDRELAMVYWNRGWPFLEAQDATGRTLRSMPGRHQPEALVTQLTEAKRDAQNAGIGPSVDWAAARRLAARLDHAKTAQADGRLGEAHRAFDEVAAHDGLDSDSTGRLGEIAAEHRDRLVAEARRALLDAKNEAANDNVNQAADALSSAARRFAASPLADDLLAAERLLRETGRFPTLTESER